MRIIFLVSFFEMEMESLADWCFDVESAVYELDSKNDFMMDLEHPLSHTLSKYGNLQAYIDMLQREAQEVNDEVCILLLAEMFALKTWIQPSFAARDSFDKFTAVAPRCKSCSFRMYSAYDCFDRHVTCRWCCTE